MKKLEKILISGTTGTAFMTLFSYLISAVNKENFTEPEHLGKMLNRLNLDTSKEINKFAGWDAHFVIGIVFTTTYVELWEQGIIKPSLKNSLLLGVVSGLLAIAVWKLTFKLHPLPPWTNYNKFYLQLVPAHIVFAWFATLSYMLLERQLRDQKNIGLIM